MNRDLLLRAAKPVWTVAVFVTAGWFLRTRADVIWDRLAELSVARIIAALLLLILAKIVLVDIVRRSIAAVGYQWGSRHVAYMTMTSQLAKYLPGGIWHLVERAGMYNRHGMSLGTGSRAILLEQTWLLVSAGCFGGALAWAGLGASLFLPEWLPERLTPFIGLAVLAPIWVVATFTSLRLAGGTLPRWPALTTNLAEQAGVWTLMGLSFWALLPQGNTIATAMTAVGAFALAWAAGYVAVFAPGGIGVREAALVVTLSPLLPSEQAAAAALVSRVIWTGAELFLGAFAHLALRGPTRGGQPNSALRSRRR